MKTILITGASGFVGSHLLEFLSKTPDVQLVGTYVSEESLAPLSHLKEKVTWVHLNMLDKEAVDRLVTESKPDEVYHLAALASAAASFDQPGETITNNVQAQVNLLEALRKENLLSTKVLIVGSAEEYGYIAPEDLPVNESAPLRPSNPYAVSKLTQDFLGLQYFLTYKMPIIRVRPFNHIGPRQTAQFAVASFAKKIVAIEKGQMDPVMKVGNMAAKRDFTDVSDMVHAYVLLMEKGVAGEVYNIGSGKSYTMQEILEKMLALATVTITTETDPSLFRPVDNPELVCDNTKMSEITGWQPEVSLDTTLKNILDYWRNLN